MDILGEFIKTQRRKKYLLMITELFITMTKTELMKYKSAENVTRHFFSSRICTYGMPTELIAVNGCLFTSKFFIDVCKMKWIQNKFTVT